MSRRGLRSCASFFRIVRLRTVTQPQSVHSTQDADRGPLEKLARADNLTASSITG
jgi:hypothetical protein